MKMSNDKPVRRHRRRSAKCILPLLLITILLTSLTIGGTMAFLQEGSNTVENSFTLAGINYRLNLEANAAKVNHADSEVTMPTALAAQDTTALSAIFTPDVIHPALVGYTFAGWHYDNACSTDYPHVDSDGKITVEYGDSEDSNPDPDKVEITLYADWTANTYEIAYNGNGATSGSMSNSTHTYDVTKNLSANEYSKSGYKFLGWSTDKNAATATYTDEQSVENLTAENGATVTLYAIWEQMDFTLTFDTQVSGLAANPPSKTVTYGETYGDLATVSRTGYTFNGWSHDKSSTDYVKTTDKVEIAGDHTVYAQWTPHTYTVKYDKNVDPNNTSITQPSGSTADSTHTYDIPKNLTENGYTRTGYTFIGWNTQADGKGKSYSNGEPVTNLTTEKDGSVTLYAQWGVKSYVIRYHANGGNGTMADQVIEWDKLTKLRENTFTKDGDYAFAGWATSPDGEIEYLENQQVVNLQESGTLNLYAKWLRNSYTVTFDYNIGYGTPPTKEVLYGEEYGVLPPYLTTETENLFKGWYTDPKGGERVYPNTIVDRKEDHTLWAHWDPSPANDIIKDLVVHSSADDNNDGVADDVHLEFVCSSSFEKFNIPLMNLVPGQTYALTYTTSNNASFGDYITGYKTARYGSYILPTATEDAGNINTAVAQDIIATWENRIEPDGSNDGSHDATNDAWLNGPWANRTITFTATKSEMYWAWEFGLIEDGIKYDYNIYDISLEPVEPNIEFKNKKLVIYNTSKAQVLDDSSSAYATNFVFDGDGYAETMYFPITGLTAGTTYTITFDHSFNGRLIHDTASTSNPSYHYGFGIMSTAPTVYGSYMNNLGTYISNTHVMPSVTGKTESVTFTFEATGSTAYWVWNMANCSDNDNCTIDIKVTNFSAKHAEGGSITYYTAASKAGSSITLDLMPEVVKEIQFIWDGIEVTNMDCWYPVDEQNPTAGDSYELAFEPMDGYTMSEVVTVTIDDVVFEVNTDGTTVEDTVAPVYNPEGNVLTIPGELLTAETKTVAVSASAVPVENNPTEPTQSTEPVATDPVSTEPTSTDAAAATEPLNQLVAIFTRMKDSLTETTPMETVASTTAATLPQTETSATETAKEVTGE